MLTFTKAAAVTAASALALTLTACGGQSSSKTDPADLETITIMGPVLDGQAPAADGQLHKAIEEYSGKKLSITWVPNSDYAAKQNAVLASGDVPEVMVVQNKTSAFVQNAQAGAFWDLTDKLAKYPNLVAKDAATLDNASVNGRVFGVFRLRDPMRTAVMVRKDWLTKLNLTMPETVEDLYNVAKAFTTQDPDGNGKADTTGLIIPKWPGSISTASPYDVMEVWFGAPNGWGERDGKLVPGFDTPEWLEANTFMRTMVAEGLVNSDFATLDSAKWNEAFFNGKGGIIVDVSSRSGLLLNLFKQQDASTYTNYVDITGNLKNSDGTMHAYPTLGYSGMLAISKQSVTSEEELDSVLSFLNTMSAKEGQVLQNNGIQDLNFKVDGNYAVTIKGAEADVVTNDAKTFSQLGTNPSGQLYYTVKPASDAEQAMFERRLAFHAADLKNAVHNPTNGLVSKTYIEKGAQLDQIISDARLKYIAGQLTEDQLKAEIKRWHTEGGDQIATELNELYKK